MLGYPDNGKTTVDIPDWAYANLTAEDNFDLAAALKGAPRRWPTSQIVLVILVPVLLIIASASYLLYRRQRRKGHISWSCKRARRVRHARRAQGWDLNGDAETIGQMPDDTEASPMIPTHRVHRVVSKFSTTTMDSQDRPPTRNRGAIQSSAASMLQTFVRAVQTLFARRPVHVQSREPAADFDLDKSDKESVSAFDNIQSHRLRKAAEANVGPIPGGGHSQQSSLASSSGLTLDVSAIVAGRGVPRRHNHGSHGSHGHDNFGQTLDPFSESGSSERGFVEEEEEMEPGVATGDSVLVISRDMINAAPSPTTTTDRRSLEVVPPTPRETSSSGYHERSPHTPLPPIPRFNKSETSLYPDEKARYRTKRPSPLPEIPALEDTLPRPETSALPPPPSKEPPAPIIFPPPPPPLSHQNSRPREKQPLTTPSPPFEKPIPPNTAYTFAAPPPLSTRTKSSPATTPQHTPHHSPNNSGSRPRPAYSPGYNPNGVTSTNPYSPPAMTVATAATSPSHSPEFRGSYFPPPPISSPGIRASDPQNLIPAAVRRAGYNPYHARSMSDMSRHAQDDTE
ncbi:hypothetical protein FA95DRAFT_1611119 [Auriscalpium vulgare]|uniref:Uncharacterized protein n=1 Tax=Auriscalpium vulgare TaxID=40419 RepID=A0ACB8RCG2_9AGAM|nr:hypothetical protein FA95DRAFT_1611119 [Auriscalpium vulgare]